ncbi:uncharacterized protein PHALS_13162 [Plasmopara halstedii]|uniref:Uncharacterized protein n=1 Tax=Plasmopara halstedii TaxID=4781 RepID=A0A0P1ANE4_PLAHL|nr:uncharacterized protein PHALS_13162 [Plasmopara halstedii]CEG42927.1 hypothetical protein PHALS_13162 [Plasmopara halstedii]|eukprot:XP_024579296.1 hypothetical protein PHALS_13162 [Plasmopara halstedii]
MHQQALLTLNDLRHPALPLRLMGGTPDSGEGGARKLIAFQFTTIDKRQIRQSIGKFVNEGANVESRVRDAMTETHGLQRSNAYTHGRGNTHTSKKLGPYRSDVLCRLAQAIPQQFLSSYELSNEERVVETQESNHSVPQYSESDELFHEDIDSPLGAERLRFTEQTLQRDRTCPHDEPQPTMIPLPSTFDNLSSR